VCQICEVAASELGAGAPSWFAALHAIGPDVQRAAPVRWRSYQTDSRGAIVGYDIPKLPAELNASRDSVSPRAASERDLFRT
jgi:hypothetical protein